MRDIRLAPISRAFVQRLKFLFALLSEVFMKTYRNVDHAVSSAVSVGSVGVPAAAKWQSQYSTGLVCVKPKN